MGRCTGNVMVHRKQYEEPEKHERWLVSYADFITLLFAFFVVMYSISSVNEGKYRVLSESIGTSFKTTKTSTHLQQSALDTVENNLNGLIQIDNLILPVPQKPKRSMIDLGAKHHLPATNSKQDKSNQIDNNKKLIETLHMPNTAKARQGNSAIEALFKNLQQVMSPLLKQGLVTINKHQDWVEVTINSRILFASGSARLSRQSLPVLKKIATLLSAMQGTIFVEGFTDNVPINNVVFPSNWELSAARAASVVYLLARSGVKPERLAATGYGEYRPIASNDSAEGRQKNRRVVLIINSKPGLVRRHALGEIWNKNWKTKVKESSTGKAQEKPANNGEKDQTQIRLGPGLR